MKKVLDLLEQNVQWFALALAVIWVLWMAWTYVIQSPVTVTINGQVLPPKDVDKYIVDTVGSSLEAKMNDQRSFALTTPKWVQAFKDEMSYKGQDAVALGPILPRDKTETTNFDLRGPGIRMTDIFVEKLPTPVPAPLIEQARSGMSNVALPAPVAAAAGADPNQPNVQPVVAQQEGRDVIWITQMYRIPTVEMAAAFRDAQIPFDQFKTTILEVVLEREEQLPDGSFGKLTRIKPLSNVQLQPVPDAKANIPTKSAFAQWAAEHIVDIVQPPFYTVLLGDAWTLPGQEPGMVAPPIDQQQQQPFDPSRYLNATREELLQLTPEQRRAVAEYKQKKADEERKSRGKPSGGGKGGLGGPGGGLGGGRGGAFGPNDGGRGAGPEGGFIDPGAFEGGPPRGPGEFPGERGEQPPQQEPQGIFANQFPLPAGEFSPQDIHDGIVGWAHDETVEPGKTYRYRITYKIRSPVWNTVNLTKPQELAQTFVIDSNPSEWGQPISVPSLTSFFVLGPASFRGEGAKVQVFRWHGGLVRQKTFDVSPGDAIGLKDGDVDYSTGWTMVDMRMDPRSDDRFVLLMDPTGRIQTRDFRSDLNNPERKKKEEAAGAAAAAAGTPSEVMAGTR